MNRAPTQDDPALSAPAATPRVKETLVDAPPSASQPAAEPQETGRLAHYRLLGELGRGGMGVVYLAEDTRLLRRVAVKVMLAHVASSAAYRARFLREARAQAMIADDHVVPIHHVDEADGVPFLEMPLLSGETLAQRLKREPRPSLAVVLEVGRQSALGLAAAHDKGLIHRDVKPSNLWLEGAGNVSEDVPRRVRVMDFGLVKPISADLGVQPLTSEVALCGTVAYMSPEHARPRDLDGRSDLFSLGTVLYEMTAGQRPFEGEDFATVLFQILKHHPVPAREVNPAVPEALSQLIQRLLAKNPADRPASAHELAAALADLEHSLKSKAGSPSGAPIPQAKPPKPRRRRWVAAGVAMLALIVAAALGFRSQQSSIHPEPPPPPPTPIQVLELDVRHFALRNDGNAEPRGILGRDSFHPRLKDEIVVTAKLSRPAYAYLILFRPDGAVQVLYPQDDGDIPERTATPHFPSKRREMSYELTEGTGLWAISLVASEEPLPSFRDWLAAHPAPSWQKQTNLPPGRVWYDDGQSWVEELSAGNTPSRGSRGEKVVAGKAEVVGLSDWAKQAGGTKAAATVGFTVSPRD